MDSQVENVIVDLGILLADWLEGAYPDRYIKVGWGVEALFRNKHLAPALYPAPSSGVHYPQVNDMIIGSWGHDKFYTNNWKSINAADPEFFEKVKASIDDKLVGVPDNVGLWVDSRQSWLSGLSGSVGITSGAMCTGSIVSVKVV